MLQSFYQTGAAKEMRSGSSFSILRLNRFNFLFSYHMEQGKIARKIIERGFGFISREGAEKDLFFHSNELKNVKFEELNEGDSVTFEVTQGPKGPSATNVNRV